MHILKEKPIPFLARIKLLIVFSYLRACNTTLSIFTRLLYRKPKNPLHILIFRTGSLGDNLCAIPSFTAIRRHYPEAKIDILVNSGATNLVSLEQLLHPAYYSEIINYLSLPKKKLLRLLKERKFDLIIQLPQTGSSFSRLIRDLFFFRMVCRAGFGWRLSTVPFFRRTQENYVHFDNETLRLKKLLAEYGIDVNTADFQLNFTTNDETLVNDLFKPVAATGKKTLAIVVGAKRPQNRWPIDYFNKVIGEFLYNYNIVLVGSNEDRVITEQLEHGESIHNFCGKLTPLQSALMLKKCDLVLSNDTGPMHLAYAVGTPLVAIFSSRDFPGKWYPPDTPQNKIFRSYGVHCSLCLSETCTNNICMKRIKPEKVVDQMKLMLKS